MDGPDQADAGEARVDLALCIDREVYSRLREAIQHLCVGLVDLNAPVRLVSSAAEAEALSLGPIEIVVHQELTWPLRRRRLSQLIDVLAGRPPSVVQAMSQGAFRVSEAVAQTLDVDLVLHVSGAADVRALQHVDGERVRHVIAASRPLAEMAVKSGRASPETITVIRPGVLRVAEPTCFTAPGRAVTVVCTNSLDARSGVDHLIHAVRILRGRGHELLAFLLGAGPREAELRHLVHACKVAPWVTFARPKGGTRRIMAGADVFVSPAPERAISDDSLAAMASGTTVVTCAGGVTDHCVDGQTAVVCPESTPEALADGIELLLNDPAYARTLAAGGLAYLKEHHPVSNMAEQNLALLRTLALRRRTFALSD